MATINQLQYEEDIGELVEFIRTTPVVALDIETTGLNVFGQDFHIRTVQFGNSATAYVVPVETMAPFAYRAFEESDRCGTTLVLHNAAFDLTALARFGFVDLNRAASRSIDTRILAHLLDPRTKHDGGIGLGLKEQSVARIGADSDFAEQDLRAVFKANKWTLSTGWANVDVNDPAYVIYAGMDVILTSRLLPVLHYEVKDRGLEELSEFEHEVSRVCMVMQSTGLLVDQPYAEELIAHYATEAEDGKAAAAKLGIENINSPAQVAKVLRALGATLTEKTATGAPKVDKRVLQTVAEQGGPAAVAAKAVLKAKQAGKFSKAYVESSLDLMDADGRVHPTIRPLQARTARMSISDPPLQQLPSGDWRIRRMFIAGEGLSLVSVDYKAVELRVLAALANEETMKAAILAGEDLHDTTATLIFGPDFTKAQRKLAKNAAFGKVYGGGAAALARNAGSTVSVMQEVIKGFDRAYPGIRKYSRTLQESSEYGSLAVVTATGRPLPLDRDRTYAATNYVVQSTARDVLAQGLLNIEAQGLLPYARLPIHDEVLAEVPSNDAMEIARLIGDAMEIELGGIPLLTDPEVLGHSWAQAPELT